MPNYRLVFAERLADTPIRSISFTSKDAREALLLAQHHDGPAELWEENQHLCTLIRTGSAGEIWVISGKRATSELAEGVDYDDRWRPM